MNLTPSQAAAVAHRGGSLLVAASAGSGKTEVLARRVAGLLLDPQAVCEVTDLLVVTFTRDAAAELRERVARMLRESMRTSAGPQRDHLRRQLVRLDEAEIGTIDAWCLRLLRGNAESAGLDPGLRVLGEEDSRLLRTGTMEELLDELLQSPSELGLAVQDWVAAQARPDTFFLRDMVYALNRRRELLDRPEAWFAAQAARLTRPEAEQWEEFEAHVAGALRAELQFQWDQFDALCDRFEDASARGALQKYRSRLKDALERLDAPSVDALAVVRELLSPKPRKPNNLPPVDHALFDQFQQQWVKKRVEEPFDPDEIFRQKATLADSIRRRRTLFDLEHEFQRRLAQRKRQRSTYEFGDILRMTLDLLAPHDAAGRRVAGPLAVRLQQRYREILIDEYQDTSPLQVELLRIVSRPLPAPGNRFMVGDVKQSIYGFRQAEPRLFVAQRDAFRAGQEPGAVQPLGDNFRSHARLLDGINRICEQLFDPRLGGTAYDADERLVARRTELPNPTLDDQPRIHVDVLPAAPRRAVPADDHQPPRTTRESGRAERDDDDDDFALPDEPLEQIEREAHCIATHVERLFADRTQVLERGPDGSPRLRPLRLADVVVLLRSGRGNAPNLAAELRGRGIPAVAGGRESLLECPEVRDVLAVLALIANQRQDIAAAAYLRGPLVGLSEPDLLTLRSAAGRDVPFAAAAEGWAEAARSDPAARALAARVRDAFQQIRAWRSAARCESPAGLVRRIIRAGNLRLFAHGRRGAAHRLAMLDALERLADDFVRGGDDDAGAFVDRIERLSRDRFEFPSGAPAGEDVVRVMTIHAAKGLEYPIVFLANAGAAFSTRGNRVPLYCGDDFGIAFRNIDARQRRELTVPGFPLLRRRERERALEEELRLLYVAMTRARERLYVVGHASRPDFWNTSQQRDRRGGKRPALIARLTAAHVLEWLLSAVASADADRQPPAGPPQVAVRAWTPEEVDQIAANEKSGAPDSPDDGRAADANWVRTAREWLTNPPDFSAARRPAVLSVSTLKQQLAQRESGDTPFRLELPPDLPTPAFARAAAARDGVLHGTVVHRFLERAAWLACADPAGVRGEIDRLVAARVLTPREAEQLDPEPIVWLMQTAAGQAVIAAGPRAAHEVPFSFGLPGAAAGAAADRILLRGVIDCVVPQADGLLLLDFKTDRPRDEAEFARRCDLYAWQMRLYATAVASIWDRPVVAATLLFLNRRAVVPVAPTPVTGEQLEVLLKLIAAPD